MRTRHDDRRGQTSGRDENFRLTTFAVLADLGAEHKKCAMGEIDDTMMPKISAARMR